MKVFDEGEQGEARWYFGAGEREGAFERDPRVEEVDEEDDERERARLLVDLSMFIATCG